jgi:hypothetical protein
VADEERRDHTMTKRPRSVPLGLSLLALAACGTTMRFVDQPPLAIDQPDRTARQAAEALFAVSTPYTVKLCEADPSSKQCKTGNRGLTATGVGGFILPLVLHVTAIVVNKQSTATDGFSIAASFQSKADGISPLCRTARGQILPRDNDTITVELHNFYCNWVLVGNVVVNADLSIDSVNLKDRMFTGFYKVVLHGTGNAAGSGYYRAVVLPEA